MFEASRLQHTITSGYIHLISDAHTILAYWAHPQSGSAFPGLVLLHDCYGLTPHIRAQTRRLAEQGYYVIAPAVIQGDIPASPEDAQILARKSIITAQSHTSAAINALKTHNKCTGRIGLVGWGFGGELVLHAAVVHEELCAAVNFYGLPADLSLAQLRALPCPLLALFAGHDTGISAEQVEQVRATLASTSDQHQLIVYPEAQRDFFNDLGNSFDAAAAEDAWTQLLAFLQRHLSPASATGPK